MMHAFISARHIAVGQFLMTAGLMIAGLGICISIPLMYVGGITTAAGIFLTRTNVLPLLVGWPWACALAGWMVFTTTTSPYASAGELPGFIFCWPLVAIWAAACTPQRVIWTMRAVMVSGSLALLLGTLQFFIGYNIDLRPLRLDRAGQHMTHASGFYSHWIRFGDAMAIWGAWLGAWCLHSMPEPRRARFATACGLIAGIAGVLLSSARGAMLAAIAGCWAAIASGSRRRAITASLIALFCAGILGLVMWSYQAERMKAAASGDDTRTYIWATAWQVFKQHPITGIGNGAYDEAARAVVAAGLSEAGPEGPDMGNAHNAFLSLLVLHGIPGLILWFGWLSSLMWAIWKRRAAHPAAWPLACATVAVILVGGLTEDLARYASSRFQLMFGLALALGLAYSHASAPLDGHKDPAP